ncbi:translocation/assembly module TamB domain-containing protein [Elizabethkingia argenteiflava]|uniref:translocation/assembly module TamB domain-containing protein n=1 Tax=Elizabethkingia argenteiflava TaxID=2681556 RepID=UPI001FCEDD50|nr:translocation/assembly module TamB [Elizabethkingia argenteiflava]
MGEAGDKKRRETSKISGERDDRVENHQYSSHSDGWVKLLLYVFYTGIGLLILGSVIITLPITKNWAADKALGFLNKDFGVSISKKNVSINIFGDVIIEDLQIKDDKAYPFIQVKEYRARSNWFSLLHIGKTNALDFESMSLKNADVKVITYKGDSLDNFSRFIAKFDDGKPPRPHKPVFKLRSRVQILDSKISIVNQNHQGEEGKWLTADHVYLTVPLLKIEGPNVSARVNNMTFRTFRWGKPYLVDTFSTDFALTQETLKFGDLTLNTDHTLLMGNLTFHLDKKTHFADFSNKVVWDMQLRRGSQISGYDIGYFVQRWDNDAPLNLSGKMKGVLNNFSLDNFLIHAKDLKFRAEKLKIKDLLKGRYHIVSDRLSTDFTYPELKSIMPKFISKNMGNFADIFQRIQFKGGVDIDPHHVLAKGELLTGIGQAHIKNIILSDYSSKQPKYKGFLRVKDLNVSAFTKNKDVGLLSGNVDIEGQGFDINTLSLKTKSDIQNIQLMGKEVHNLFLEGVLAQKKYNGLINLNDTQVKASVRGLIDFSTKRLQADIKSHIDYLNLSYFGYQANSNTNVSGFLEGKFSMTDINDLNLDASIEGLKLTTTEQKLDIPNAHVKAFFDGGDRIIDVDAPGAVKGKIIGHYNLADLGNMVQSGLGNILVGYLPKHMYKGQHFNMEFEVQQKLLSYFLPDARIPRGGHIKAFYTGTTNDLVMDADVPALKYIITKKEEVKEADKMLARVNPQYKIDDKAVSSDTLAASGMQIKINTTIPQEQILANIREIEYAKNIVKDVMLKGTNENGKILRIASLFKAGNVTQDESGHLKEYAINFNQTTSSSGDIAFRFEPTSVKLNNDMWSVDTSEELNHSILYLKKKKGFEVNHLRLYSDDSSILINGFFKGSKDFDADIQLNKLQLAKVLSFIPTSNKLNIQGIANGSAKIKMSKNDLQPIVDIQVGGIKMSGQEVGDLIVNAKSTGSNIYEVEARITSSGLFGGNHLSLTGNINNNTSSPTLDLTAALNAFNIAFAGEFVKDIFSNLRGKANGEIKITGPLNDLDYSGDIAMKGLGFKLMFTGVDYSFADAVIPLSKGIVQLNDLALKDGRYNSAGSISGIIQFENFASLGVNLIVRADNLLLLNTSQKDFDSFWGRVTAKGDLYIWGPVSALDILARASVIGGSEFTLNTNTTSSVEEFKMLRFLKINKETGEVSIEKKLKTGGNIAIGLVLDVDKNSAVNVLLGENVGSISVRGQAHNLKFNMKRSGLMNMNGVYTVDNGTFVSKAILERTFQIHKGSNILWDENVMNPELNIVASYHRVVTNLGEYLSVGKLQPTNVELQIKIKNKLQELNKTGAIAMNILLPDASSQIKEALAAKVNTEDEKIKQIGSVLIMNSFNLTSSLDGVALGNAAVSTGYSMVFKNLASVFNAISNDFQIDMDYIKGDQSAEIADRANTNININLSPRIKVKTGIGIPISRTDNVQNNYLSGEGSIEYDVSKTNDGSLVLRAYSKPANIGAGVGLGSNASENQSYGAGIAYIKSFNSFGELFRKKKNTRIKGKKADILKAKNIRDSIGN